MPDITTIKITLHDNLPALCKRYPIAKLAVFGSYVRGEETPQSDIDIMVEFNGSIGLEFIDLAEDLEKILGSKVDLISKGGLKPRHWEYLKERVQYV